jgi:hypothetical protein
MQIIEKKLYSGHQSGDRKQRATRGGEGGGGREASGTYCHFMMLRDLGPSDASSPRIEREAHKEDQSETIFEKYSVFEVGMDVHSNTNMNTPCSPQVGRMDGLTQKPFFSLKWIVAHDFLATLPPTRQLDILFQWHETHRGPKSAVNNLNHRLLSSSNDLTLDFGPLFNQKSFRHLSTTATVGHLQ